ncbi:MAG: hypothetical protein ACK5YA_00230 [bacterium]
MKNEDIKSLITALESQEITLEDLLINTDFIQPTVKVKFPKFLKYFMRKEWIEKLIYYSLNYDSHIKNYTSISHNACEILSQVKHSAFLTEIAKSEDYDENNKSFPYLDIIFEFIVKKEKKVTDNKEGNESTKMELENEVNELYCEEMLSGYFERIILNLYLKVKKKVRKNF